MALRLAALTHDDVAFNRALASLEQRGDKGGGDALKQALGGAALAGNGHAVAALLAAGVDPDATTGMTAATPMVYRIDAMRALVAAGADVYGGLPAEGASRPPAGTLEAALVAGQIQSVQWLLENGYDMCRGDGSARVARLISHPAWGDGLPAPLKAKLACHMEPTRGG